MKNIKIIMLAIFLVSIAMLPVSCGWKTDGMQYLEQEYGLGGDEDVELEEAEIPEVELEDIATTSLAGRWAMHMSMSGTLTPLTEPWDIKIVNLFLVDITDDEDEMTLTYCKQIVDIDGIGDMGKNKIPDALSDALSAAPIVIQLPGDGSVPAHKIGWPWGIKLDDSVNDDISEVTADDTRVFDQDNDGEDGITIEVLSPAGFRYMISRTLWDMSEGVISEDLQWINGSLKFKVDDVVFGATSSLLKTVAPITSNDTGNTFSMRRMSATDIPIDGDVDLEVEIDNDVIDSDVVDHDVVDGDADQEIEMDSDVVDNDVIDNDVVESDVVDNDVVESDVLDVDDESSDLEPSESLKSFKAGGYTCEQLIKDYRGIFVDANK